MLKLLRQTGFVLILLFYAVLSFAQIQNEEEPDTAKSSIVIIDKADRIKRQLTSEREELLILTGNVEMHQDSLFMSCDSARKEGNNLLALGNVILQQWDSLNVFSEQLQYFGDRREAYLKDSVVLQSKDQKLFTDSLAYNTATRVAVYDRGAILTNDTTTLYSRRGTYYVALDEIYFKDSIQILSDQFELFADTLKFNTKEQKAYFLGPTRIDLENGSRVYCEGGYFDMTNKEALFTQNAQYVDVDQVAEGDSIFYDGELKEVILIGNASLTEPGKKALADRINFNEETEVLELQGNAFFEDSTRTLRSEQLVYDTKKDQLYSTARSSLVNGNQQLDADTIDFDNIAGLGRAVGNIIFRDTASDYTVLCHQALYNDSTGYLKAYGGRPLFISKMEKDSFYLAADTLVFSEKQNETDTFRIFEAFQKVGIYKRDLQATCDSLSYSSLDSMFRLYRDPIIWSDTSQFTADTVSILLADETIDKIFLDQNAFILNSADQILFNQMQGKNITAFFKEGEVHRMLISGNASSIYYALDDSKAYIGVNETLCSNMLLRFGNNEVTDITFYDNPEAKFHPIQEVNPEALKLEGFDWRINERPKSVLDLTDIKF